MCGCSSQLAKVKGPVGGGAFPLPPAPRAHELGKHA